VKVNNVRKKKVTAAETWSFHTEKTAYRVSDFGPVVENSTL